MIFWATSLYLASRIEISLSHLTLFSLKVDPNSSSLVRRTSSSSSRVFISPSKPNLVVLRSVISPFMVAFCVSCLVIVSVSTVLRLCKPLFSLMRVVLVTSKTSFSLFKLSTCLTIDARSFAERICRTLISSLTAFF